MLFQRISSCQLPVFFLLDTSRAMEGVLSVTMQQGLLTMRNRLQQHAIARYQVYLRCISLSEKPPFEPLSPVALFEPPIWQAQDSSLWRPALAELSRSLTFDLLVENPADPRGYYLFPPLIFFVLASLPTDQWLTSFNGLLAATSHLNPLCVVVVTDRRMGGYVRQLRSMILLLEQGHGEYMSNFFLWVTQLIESSCERHLWGEKDHRLLPLPYGMQLLQ